MTKQLDLQAQVEEIRRLAEQMMVECPNCQAGQEWSDRTQEMITCMVCHGTGQVPDPAFVPLLDAVRKRCWRCEETDKHQGCHDYCFDCHNTGYITRNWAEIPEGALEGALKRACQAKGLPPIGLYQVFNADGDEQTTWAVIEWLKSLLPVHVPSTHVGPASPRQEIKADGPEIWIEMDYPFPPKRIRLVPGVIIRRILKEEVADANP